MADKIPVDIETTGDTKGAEDVEKSIFKVRDAAKELQDLNDVATAQAGQAAAIQEKQAQSLEEIANAAHRVVAQGLADSVGKISEHFSELGPEVGFAAGAVQNFLEVFAATGDPIKASMAIAVTAIGGVVTAYKQAEAQAAQIAKQEQDDVRRFAELRRDLASQLRAENLTAFFQSELNVLDKQVDALERRARISQSVRAADSAVQDATGGPQSPDQKIFEALNRGIAELDAKIKTADSTTAALVEKADFAQAAAKNAVETFGEGHAEAEKLVAAADTARAAADNAQSSAEETKATADAEKIKLQATAVAALKNFGDESGKTVTDFGNVALEGMKDYAQTAGVKLSGDQKSAFDKISKLLTDGIPDKDQISQIEAAVTEFRGSLDMFHQSLFDNFTALVTGLGQIDTENKRLESQRGDLINQMLQNQAELRARLDDQGRFLDQIHASGQSPQSSR